MLVNIINSKEAIQSMKKRNFYYTETVLVQIVFCRLQAAF